MKIQFSIFNIMIWILFILLLTLPFISYAINVSSTNFISRFTISETGGNDTSTSFINKKSIEDISGNSSSSNFINKFGIWNIITEITAITPPIPPIPPAPPEPVGAGILPIKIYGRPYIYNITIEPVFLNITADRSEVIRCSTFINYCMIKITNNMNVKLNVEATSLPFEDVTYSWIQFEQPSEKINITKRSNLERILSIPPWVSFDVVKKINFTLNPYEYRYIYPIISIPEWIDYKVYDSEIQLRIDNDFVEDEIRVIPVYIITEKSFLFNFYNNFMAIGKDIWNMKYIGMNGKELPTGKIIMSIMFVIVIHCISVVLIWLYKFIFKRKFVKTK